MKTLNSKQKLVIERMYRLFYLANEMNKGNHPNKDILSKKYLSLAKTLGEKVNVSIPKELKKQFCSNCFSLNITSTKNDPFLIIKCNDCSKERKYSLDKKK